MTTKAMIDRIYEIIMGYSSFENHRDCTDRCMIGDVLNWIDHNCNWIDNGDTKSRDIDRHRDLIVQIYYWFIKGLNKPIEEQDEDCILFIYNLIEGQLNKGQKI